MATAGTLSAPAHPGEQTTDISDSETSQSSLAVTSLTGSFASIFESFYYFIPIEASLDNRASES